MAFELSEIDRVVTIDPYTFHKKYVVPRRPLVITGVARQWPAYTKWTLDYLKQVCGEQVVPLYDNSKADPGKKVNQPVEKMRFADYLDLIASQPTELRIFLFNIFKHAPQLCEDFSMPNLMPNFMDKFPMMFYGGAGSRVFLHYDLDLSHVFITQFYGKKRAILFAPEYSQRLYKLPFAVHNLEDIDIEDPDEARFPALKGIKGLQTTLEHGDMLFMPTGWWHYMSYLEGGFALSLRALDKSLLRKAEGAYNVLIMRQLDNAGRALFGQRWFNYKERAAYNAATRYQHQALPALTLV